MKKSNILPLGKHLPATVAPDIACQCCECQGISCFAPHPGHSHSDYQKRRKMWPEEMKLEICENCGLQRALPTKDKLCMQCGHYEGKIYNDN